MDWIYFSSGAAVVVILLIIVAVRKHRRNNTDYSEPEPADDVKPQAPEKPAITEPLETTLTHVGKDGVSRSIWLSPNGHFFTRRVAASGRKYNDYIEGDAMIDCQAEIISSRPDLAAYFGWM